MSLPREGTAARELLHREALQIAVAALRARPGCVADALYSVHAWFRVQLLEQRGLMDQVPGRDAASVEALRDARTLEQYVATAWSDALLRTFRDAC